MSNDYVIITRDEMSFIRNSTTPSEGVPLKRCTNTKCQHEHPATPEFFYRNKLSKDGFDGYCKTCSKERHKIYLCRPEVRTRQRAYRKAYFAKPGNNARHRADMHNRRAAKRGAHGTHTSEQIQEQLKRQKCRCYYCSTKFEQRYIYHVDHTFPTSRVAGNDPINSISYLVLACPHCNDSKGKKYPHEFPEGGKLL